MWVVKPLILIILDGWGYAPAWGGNAISQAQTPNFDKLWREYPHTTLAASGQFVGLPGHEQGNSEVGHLNIGAGRVVRQDISRINQAIKDKSFFGQKALLEAIKHCRKFHSQLHLMGLVSDGSVHSHIDHLFALLELAQKENFSRVFIHAFTDGRDAPSMSGLQYIARLEKKLKEMKTGTLATVSGRYWAMDRDHHWDRIYRSYQAMVLGLGPFYSSAAKAISENYKMAKTDEFIIPSVIVDKNNQPIAKISDNDAIIFFNFRSDRARQITIAFCKDEFRVFNQRKKLSNLYFVTIIPYGVERELGLNIHSAFTTEEIKQTLAEVLSKNNLPQFHLAETEKYAHVTYFFNGGREKPFPGEERLMIPSPKVATYDLKPEMSVQEITSKFLAYFKKNQPAFTVLNFANPDMVGHTGNLLATIKAIETVDQCLSKIISNLPGLVPRSGVGKPQTSNLIITADHGNAEEMLDPKTGEIDTEHSCNPVPFILVSDLKIKTLKQNGVLADIAPTILRLMGLRKPPEMTGEPLISL